MSEQKFDVIVVGMGPGGEEVAERLAEAGLRVAGVEHELVGGECPYWGCIPSKMMVRAADALAEAHRVPLLAGDGSVRSDWAPVARRIREQATDSRDDRAAVERFEGPGGRLFRGRGRLTGPSTVGVGDDTLEASNAIMVATGSSPVIPPIPGLADVLGGRRRDGRRCVHPRCRLPGPHRDRRAARARRPGRRLPRAAPGHVHRSRGGAVGLTEEQAGSRGIRTRTGYAPLSQASRGFIHGPGAEGFFKLVEDTDRGVLVGATAAGPSGGEMLSLFEVAVAAEVPTDRLRNLIYPFPTFHRGVEVALQALGAPVAAA